jgi:organic hydroperoxide reductase OsmC/OhrA
MPVMSEHVADVRWKLSGEDFKGGKYTREHTWSFDGGATVLASSSPAIVKVPWSNAAGVDPEEAFVASISSCHLLTFLWLASKRGLKVLSYEDHAVGTMSKNERRVPWVSHVVLEPRIEFAGTPPNAEELAALHREAHEQCFIASSVKTEITVKGVSH